jgi:hypothetical protein
MTTNTTIPSRRALLAGAPAVAAAALAAGGAVNILAMGTARPSSVDPIFALIEQHREAILAFGPAIDEGDTMMLAANWTSAERDVFVKAASRRELEALKVVLTTPPTTLAGVVALLEHLGQPEWFEDTDLGENPEWESLLSGARDSPGCDEARQFPLMLAAAIRSLIA